jgi:hypothetical protein
MHRHRTHIPQHFIKVEWRVISNLLATGKARRAIVFILRVRTRKMGILRPFSIYGYVPVNRAKKIVTRLNTFFSSSFHPLFLSPGTYTNLMIKATFPNIFFEQAALMQEEEATDSQIKGSLCNTYIRCEISGQSR